MSRFCKRRLCMAQRKYHQITKKYVGGGVGMMLGGLPEMVEGETWQLVVLLRGYLWDCCPLWLVAG